MTEGNTISARAESELKEDRPVDGKPDGSAFRFSYLGQAA